MSESVEDYVKTEPLLVERVVIHPGYPNNNGGKKVFSPIWRQSLTCVAAVYMLFVGGMTLGFSAILLPQLKQPGSPIPSSLETDSWIAAISVLSTTPGSLFVGFIMDRFGRRASLYIISVPLILSWLMISWANSLWMMLVARLLEGFCFGYMGPVAPTYMGETTDPKHRGFFLASIPLAISFGILFAHLVGSYMLWQWASLVFGLTPIIGILIAMCVPESPVWLMSKGRKEEGIEAFVWLRGHSKAANQELKGLTEHKVQKAEVDWRDSISTMKSPVFYKPTLIATTLLVLYNFCGVNAFIYYTVEMIQKSVGDSLDSYALMLIMDVVRIFMSVAGCVVCKKYRRRPLSIITGVWTGASLFVLSGFMYFVGGSPSGRLSWVPVTCLISYTCAVAVGLTPLVWTVFGEIFPPKVRNMGPAISSSIGMIAYFIVVKVAPRMLLEWGEALTFLVYGLVGFSLAIVMYYILPETFGKTIQEVEAYFEKKKDEVLIFK